MEVPCARGVILGFAQASVPDDVHLMLVGPDVTGVADDPEGSALGVISEGEAVLRRLRAADG